MSGARQQPGGAFAGRVVVVTGAASGIGAAVAAACLAQGAEVTGVDRDRDGLLAAAGEYGERFTPEAADITDEESLAATARRIAERHDAVDALVNCAGVGGFTGDVTETPPADWHRILGINLTGVYLVSRAVLPLMRPGTGAAVVNVASQYGLVGGAGFPAYCAAKAGVVGLTKAMAVDHAPDGIRVNCVCPGPTDTPMLRLSRPEASGPHREDARVAGRSLLPAPGSPHDVAAAVLFLLSPAAAGLTGAAVPVDGGWTAC